MFQTSSHGLEVRMSVNTKSWVQNPTKAIGEEHSVINAPVLHLNKSLAQFTKKTFPSGVSHRDSDYKLA